MCHVGSAAPWWTVNPTTLPRVLVLAAIRTGGRWHVGYTDDPWWVIL